MNKQLLANKPFSKEDTAVIKGIAILIMMLHHCFLSHSRFEDFYISFYPFSEAFIIKAAETGKCCVGIFTFLSAYGMARSFLAASPGFDFTGKTAGRLTLKRYINLMSGFLPAYLFGLIGCCIFQPSPLSVYKGWKTFPLYMLIDMLGIADLLKTPSLVGTWWYMGLALTLILAFPLLLKAYNKCGVFLAPAFFCIICALNLEVTTYSRWILLAPIGILFADLNILEKIKAWRVHGNPFMNFLIRFVIVSFFLFQAVWYSSWNYGKLNYLTLILDTFLTVMVIIWCYLFITDIPVIKNILQFLGKHSMNVFLIHTFIRTKWFYEYTYSFVHFIPIMLILLAESVLISMAMEALKKYSGYNNMVQKLVRSLTAG